ncbi:hypothetical protein PG993_008234 [Apiospora rasikravindrae]|uniref:Protein-S-isoprenylcysteine O-methyltransferase n=1 Tax=Apiospora rasikravindrae TaxID=990691 RepID=A0ABR1SZR7_9PEZI
MIKTDDRQAGPAPTAQSLQHMVVKHWGDSWHSPDIDESRLCIVLSATVATLLGVAVHYTTVGNMSLPDAVIHYTTSDDLALHLVAGVLLKTLCFGVEVVLLHIHGYLRQLYPAYFYTNHTPGHAGVVFACMVLFLRMLVFRYEPDVSLLMYNLEIWFWAAYWVEWWTGGSIWLLRGFGASQAYDAAPRPRGS